MRRRRRSLNAPPPPPSGDYSSQSGEGSFDAPEIARFDSLAEFMAEFDRRGVRIRDDAHWTGQTAAEVRASIIHGDTAAVPAAEALMDRIGANLEIRGAAPAWGRAPVGAFPDVPAFLAGSPDCMIRRVAGDSPRSPVRFYMTTACAAGITHEMMATIGSAMLAAVMAVSRYRPVEAYYYTPMGLGDHAIRLRTDPMVLSEAAYMLSNVAFFRAVSLEYGMRQGFRGTWGAWACTPRFGPGGAYTPERRIAHMRKCLGLGDDDVLVPQIDLATGRAIAADPAAWVDGILAKYRD